MDSHKSSEFGSSVEHIRHIEKAKVWAAVLGVIFVFNITGNIIHEFVPSKAVESWYFGAGQYRLGAREIDNSKETAETGISITGNSYNLQERGKPKWIINAIGLLAVIQISRHLRKSYSMPGLLSDAKRATAEPT